jgi:3-methyl-2-oxobutanoate hydroxymethyltransferase
MKITVPEIISRKNKQKISVLTAYTHPIAKILDGEVDMILVGDSLGMVLYGMDSTLTVTLDMMIEHGKAVTRAAKKSLVVVDMPFGSYQENPAQAFRNAARIISETNCQAVKLEGGVEMAETIRFLVDRGIPVVGHIGLEPQSFNVYGGYRIQGKDKNSEDSLIQDAKALEKAGCFAIVLEGIKKTAADKITKAIKIPTIGIGASVQCDGQVLVTDDMLGLFEQSPKFVKHYADIKKIILKAVKSYTTEVSSKKFPGEENCY